MLPKQKKSLKDVHRQKLYHEYPSKIKKTNKYNQDISVHS